MGLTGSVEDIRHVAREYRVYYMKTEDEGNDYLVDHSIIMYVDQHLIVQQLNYGLRKCENPGLVFKHCVPCW